MLQKDGEIIPMTEQEFDQEVDLQHILAEHPELLLSDYLGINNSNLILVKREASIPGDALVQNTFYLDHLFLDTEGIPTLVEVKQSTDTRIRREVVGQMLDYAANAILYWPIDEIRGMFNTTWEKRGKNPEDKLQEFLGPEKDLNLYWNEVKKNLLSGNIRLLFVADSIPDTLKNIVQFLNKQMDPAEVLAVDIHQFIGHDFQILVPKVYGIDYRPVPNKTKRKWNEEEFLTDLKEHVSQSEVITAKKILEWANSHGLRIWWGEGSTQGSFYPMVDHKGRSHQVIAVWTYGKVELQFQWMKNYDAFSTDERRREFLRRVNSIPGITISDEKIAMRPSFDLSILNNETNFKQFIEILDWFVEEIRAT